MAYELTDAEKVEVRLQLGSNITTKELTDEQIDSDSILGAASDYVFDSVTENINQDALTDTQKAIVASLLDGSSENIDMFISDILVGRQSNMYRRAVVYRCAGNAASTVRVITAEVNAGISQRQQVSPAEVKRASLFLQADEQIVMLKNLFPDDPIPDVSGSRVVFNLFSTTSGG